MTMLLMKATLAMLIALGAAAALRRARASLRHAVFVALFAFLLLLPFSPRVLPKMDVQVPARVVANAPIVDAPAAPVERRPPTAGGEQTAVGGRLYTEAYLAGVLIMLASLATGIIRLRRCAASGEVWLDGTHLATAVACANGIRRAVLVVVTDEVSVPMTFGFRRQTILLPSNAPEWDEGA
ncbi:MAG TPA: hypothetical protein VJZ00_23045, partial [Thermoanaerobaculia bacterium]|nr:hypothetical protein [Thermoanaerobaculia bacterium]